MSVICVLLNELTNPIPSAEACIRYTPKIALGTHWFFLDIAGCEKLYSERGLLLRLQAHAKRRNAKIKLGVGRDAASALSFAQFPRKEKRQLPIDALNFYLNPFVDANESGAVAEACVKAMLRLGVRTLGELDSLKRSSLLRRFGPEVLAAVTRIQSVDERPWPFFQPKEAIIEQSDIEPHFGVQTLEPILFILSGLLERIFDRVRGRGQTLLALKLSLTQEASIVIQDIERVFEFDFASPQTKAKDTMKIIKERLERELSANPLVRALHKAEMTVIRCTPQQDKQADFFKLKDEVAAEALNLLVARLSERLGEKNVFFASFIEDHRPESEWKKQSYIAREDKDSAHAPRNKRPLRILQSPILLQKEVQGVTTQLTSKNKKWIVKSIGGPERIKTQWWSDGVARDYFFVVTNQDEELWIFFDIESGNYFLHGVFD